MFVTKNQLFVFIACIAFGGCFGIFFSFTCFLKKVIKNKALSVLIDITTFILMGALFICYAYFMHFPSSRVYMPVGVCLGSILYFKSLHIILAKCAKKFYNICRKIKEKVINDRFKIKKANSCDNSGGCDALSDPSFRYDLSTNSNREQTKRTRRIKCKN